MIPLTQMLAIVDYDTGNLRSIENMLKTLGVTTKITRKRTDLETAAGLILPGVGHFDFGMQSLKRLDLIGLLNDLALADKRPVLGICLGLQLMTRGSEEGNVPGLGWIAADTRVFDRSRLGLGLRVPHMGWADTEFRSDSHLFAGIVAVPRFYYVHSFHVVTDRAEDELCHAVHGYRFTAGIERGNIAGVQFHPEKSHRFGKAILANFAHICGVTAR